VTVLAVLGIGLLLAYANGANDNYKGVATLLGRGRHPIVARSSGPRSRPRSGH